MANKTVPASEFRGVKDFRDLEVWAWCRELRRDVEAMCERLPRPEQTRLADQMIRAARSVTANLAEGFGRHHYRETVQSCRMARGSLFELLDHFVVASDKSYLKPAEFEAFENRIRSGIKLLNGFVRYLQSRKDGAGEKREREQVSRSTNKPVNR